MRRFAGDERVDPLTRYRVNLRTGAAGDQADALDLLRSRRKHPDRSA